VQIEIMRIYGRKVSRISSFLIHVKEEPCNNEHENNYFFPVNDDQMKDNKFGRRRVLYVCVPYSCKRGSIKSARACILLMNASNSRKEREKVLSSSVYLYTYKQGYPPFGQFSLYL